jgi:hypothetical protein
MKPFFHAVAWLVCLVSAVQAQNYQTQYPYDPYSGTPQPQAQPQPGGYEGYSAPTYGSGYSSKSSSSSGGYSYNETGGTGVYGDMLTWGQLEAYYGYNDFENDDLDGDGGFGVDLRVKLMKPLYLHFGLDRITSSDPQARSLEVTTFTAGAGVYAPIGSRLQIYGEVGFRYDFTSGDLEDLNEDDLSLYVRPGVRFALTDRWELTGSVLFNDTENFNDSVIELSAYFALLDWLDVGGGVDFGSDINTYRIGGRWRWD